MSKINYNFPHHLENKGQKEEGTVLGKRNKIFYVCEIVPQHTRFLEILTPGLIFYEKGISPPNS